MTDSINDNETTIHNTADEHALDNVQIETIHHVKVVHNGSVFGGEIHAHSPLFDEETDVMVRRIKEEIERYEGYVDE